MSYIESLSKKCSDYYKKLERTSYGKDHPVKQLLDEYDRANPGLNSFELKAAQYEILAENIDTVVFEESPFYFINDITWCAGRGLDVGSLADWLYQRNYHIYEDADPETWRKFNKQQALRLYLCCGPYTDAVHFGVPVGNVVRYGMKKFYEDAEKAKIGATKDELDFLNCAQRGILAAKRICERYKEEAERKLTTIKDPELKKNMELLIDAASCAPWEAPKTFFEGLNTCWFCRNVLGALEGIGNPSLGRPDLLLNDLYLADLEAGRITREDAYELIKQFFVLGDMQYDKDTIVCGENDQELEMGVTLGGCDSEGKPVYNELTSMFIQAQRDTNSIYPKIHARIASDSPQEYLEELANEYTSGRSTIGLSGDDGTIPGLVDSGNSLEDARDYIIIGCWGNQIDSKEAMAMANYIYMVTYLEQAVYGPEEDYIDAGVCCTPLSKAQNFEDVYSILTSNLRDVLRWRCEAIGKYGKLAPLVNPLCLVSSFMDGCIESRKDYSQGGAKYKVNSCDIAGYANYLDAMLAIKKLCFDDQVVTLNELLEAVRHNWEGNEELLYKVRHCPHFGDNTEESKELSHRLHNDIYHMLDGIENEHGGKYIINFYVYREFFRMGKEMRATPDGRKDGEMFAHGIGPSKYHPADSLADLMQTVCDMDPEKSGTTALDIQLPFGKTTKEQLATMLRVFTKMGVKHLQVNCVSLDDLKDAQVHPERHQDLIVRVTGFSAKFVSLSKEFQEEIMSRHIFEE